jgi:DNA-binding transcriptional regulator YhcF (GntR family)
MNPALEQPPRRRRSELADSLRRRVVGALSSGSLRRGERLPSAREVAAEVDADPRLVLAAYRILAREGVVEIRRRSGIYVASTPQVQGGPAVVADGWLVDVLTEAVEHGISATRVGDWLKRCTTTRRLRAAVVAETVDQLDAFCGELRDDYGVDAVPFAPDALDRPGRLPPRSRRRLRARRRRDYAERLRAVLTAQRKRVVAVRCARSCSPVWLRAAGARPRLRRVSDARSVADYDARVWVIWRAASAPACSAATTCARSRRAPTST